MKCDQLKIYEFLQEFQSKPLSQLGFWSRNKAELAFNK